MTVSTDRARRDAGTAGPPRARQASHHARGLAGGLAYGAALLPLALAGLAATVVGRGPAAVGWWHALQRRLLARPAPPRTRRPGRLALLGHAGAGVFLGLAALAPLLLVALFVARGVLYGVVVDGPYDHSWGGPTRAGAWAAHFLVGVPFAVLGLFLLRGIAALHARLTAAVDGVRPGWWVVPATMGIGLAASVFTFAWSRQI